MKLLDCHLEAFLDTAKNINVICFGGGNYFESMCYDIGDRLSIIAILDNDPMKWGKTVRVGNVQTKIFPPAKIKQIPGYERSALLVTASAYASIVAQLKDNYDFHDMICYLYPTMKFKGLKPIDSICKSSSKPLIPKIIHYGWFGGNPIPQRLLRIMESWKEHCPEYDIVSWNESNYNVKKNAYLKAAYEQKRWTFVNDYARIDIICQNGGIFLDTDVEILKNLDDLRYNAGFVGMEPICGINLGSGFGAAKEFPAFCALLETFDREFSRSTVVELKSNLGRETAFFYNKGFRPNGEYQVIADTAIFPFNVLAPKIREIDKTILTDASFCLHHFDGSWVQNY